MENMECPLCSSKRVESLEPIAGESLYKLYSSMVDVSGLSSNLWKDCTYALCKDCDLRFFEPAICGDEKFYNTLQTYPWYYQDEKNEFGLAAVHLKPGMAVLDVGAGKGAFKRYATGCEYTGLEFSEEARKYASKLGVTIERKSIEEFSAKRPHSMDVVCSFQVLEHVSRPASFLSACVDALKPGGKLIISVPAFDGFTGMVINAPLNLPPHHVSRWSNRSQESVARIYNLKLISLVIEPIQPIHADGAKHAKLTHVFRKYFGLPLTCIDFSVAGKIVAKLSVLAVKLRMRANGANHGHSVVAVYEK